MGSKKGLKEEELSVTYLRDISETLKGIRDDVRDVKEVQAGMAEDLKELVSIAGAAKEKGDDLEERVKRIEEHLHLS